MAKKKTDEQVRRAWEYHYLWQRLPRTQYGHAGSYKRYLQFEYLREWVDLKREVRKNDVAQVATDI